MKEQIEVGGKKVWILIEPHLLQKQEGQQEEYFTASYTFAAFADEPDVVLFVAADGAPMRFESPVQALEYASEKLLGIS